MTGRIFRKDLQSLAVALLLCAPACGGGGGGGASPDGDPTSPAGDGVTLEGNLLDTGSTAGDPAARFAPGLTVSVAGSERSGAVDADGAFRLTDLPSGDLLLLFAAAEGPTRGLELRGIPAGSTVALRDVRFSGASAVAGGLSLDEEPPPGEALPLEADIVADDTTGPAPLGVVFSATLSGDIVGAPLYAWDFGDGGSSSDAEPFHEFVDPGAYVVTLIVTDDETGEQATDTIGIVVEEPEAGELEVEASGSPSEGVAPLEVSFDAQVSGAGDAVLGYDWSFGDGRTSTEAAPSHTYVAEGSYTAVVTVTDDDGRSAADSIQIEVDDDADNQVPICHAPPGNPDNAHTIRVGEPALPAHLAHGDTVGPCEGDGEPVEDPPEDPEEPEEPGVPEDPEEPEPPEDPPTAERVTICHRPPGNPDNERTLEVDADSVADHLGHGDTLGACGS